MRILLATLLSLFLLLHFASAGSKWVGATHFSTYPVYWPVEYSSDVYTLTHDGLLHLSDAASGGARTVASLDSDTDVPMARSDTDLFYGSNGGTIYSRSLLNGRTDWQYRYQQNDSDGHPVALTLKYLDASGSLVYAVYDKRLVVLTRSGSLLYTRPLTDGASATAANGGVYVMDGATLTFFGPGGTSSWSASPGATFKSRPGYDATLKQVYVSTTTGRVFAFDAVGGSLKWSYEVPGWAMTTPVSDGKVVAFASNDGYLYGLDAASGQPVYRTATGWAAWGQPAPLTLDGVAYALFGTQNNSAALVRLSDGQVMFDYPLSGPLQYPAISSDNRVAYASTHDGSLLAFNLYPLCTIDTPKSGQYIPPEVVLQGRAFSPSKIDTVQLSINNQPLAPISVANKGTFSYDLDLSGQPLDEVVIQCTATDRAGLLERDALGYKSRPILSLTAPKVEMTAYIIPSNPAPGAPFTLYAKSSQSDLRGVLVEYQGRNQTLDTPAQLNAPLSSGRYTLIVRKAGYAEKDIPLELASDYGFLPLVALIVFTLIVASVYLYLKRRAKIKIVN